PSAKNINISYTVTGTATATDDYTATSGTLTINARDTQGSIRITGIVDDNIDEPNETIIITLASTDAMVIASTHTYTIIDNDTVGVSVSPTSITTSEDSRQAPSTFTIQLDSQPSANVNIGLSSSAPTEGTVTPDSITFTAGNWNRPQTIAVTGVDDLIKDGDQTYNIVTTKTTSSDSKYNDLEVADVSAINIDNDIVFFITGINSTDDINENTEFMSATPTIFGDTPIGKLTYSLKAGDDQAQFTVNADTGVVSMIARDYENQEDANKDNIYKTTLIVIDESNNTASLELSVSVKDVLEFEELSTSFLSIDLPKVSVGKTAIITLQLKAKDRKLNDSDLMILQGHPVNIIRTDSPGLTRNDKIKISKLTNNNDGTYTAEISSDNSGPATVGATIGTLRIQDVPISFTTTSTEAYTLVADPTTVIADNTSISTLTAVTRLSNGEFADFPTNKVEFKLVEGGATIGTVTRKSEGTYSASIASDTTGQAKIELWIYGEYRKVNTIVNFIEASSISRNATLTANKTSVIANNIESTITLQVKDDAGNSLSLPDTTVITMTDNSNNATLSAVTAHDNGKYTATIKSKVVETVEITAKIDNQPVREKAQVDFVNGVIVEPKGTIITTEKGAYSFFNITLLQKPTSNVQINLESSDSKEGTITQHRVTFTPISWGQAFPRSVKVTGVNDNVDDGDIDYKILTSTAYSDDPVYKGIIVPDVNARNLDDDTAGISVSAISGDTTEAGGEATFTIQLDSKPIDSVIFYIKTSNIKEGRLKGSVKAGDTIGNLFVEFTPSNWGPQTFTVIGQNDGIDDYDTTYQVVNAYPGYSNSSDPKYSFLPFPPITVKNISNPIDGIILSTDTLTTVETLKNPRKKQFGVKLKLKPRGATVVLGLHVRDKSEGVIDVGQGLTEDGELTFTQDNWNIEQYVEVIPRNDDQIDGDQTYKIDISEIVLTGALSNKLLPKSVTVTNRDDDIDFRGFRYGTVTSPHAPYRVWLDRNLAASKVVDSSIPTTSSRLDERTYGDYYQWGRRADGHQEPLSQAKGDGTSDFAVSIFTRPGESWFYWGTTSWLDPDEQRDWVFENVDQSGAQRQVHWRDGGRNDICPAGYHPPSLLELQHYVENGGKRLRTTWDFFRNFLALPMAGQRWGKDSKFHNKGIAGYYWTRNNISDGNTSTTKYEERAYALFTNNTEENGGGISTDYRHNGSSVRCIKK
ncbi:MAG: hypothetical protein FE834_10620, partial [Gammaproteobacteria bacterium]|nr:hypothetical protein [Gammaproteobacteria bacterium]